jgi:acyl carrier protein
MPVAVDEHILGKIMGVIQSLDGMTPDVIAQVTPRTNIVRDLNLDSIAVMDFIMEVEIAFDTVIPMDAVASIETIEDLARILDPQTVPAAL